MKEWQQSLRKLLKNKYYLPVLALAAAAAYGFMVTHQTVGIDDTPYAYYFEEGLAAIVGRWVLFLANKVLHFAEFAPFLTDLAGVLLLMAAVTVWTVLFVRILGSKAPAWGCVLFAALFMTNPLLAEIYPYFLHNGASLGYLCCGVSLCALWMGLPGGEKDKRKPLYVLLSAVLLWIAIGCYESFMVVWLMGVLLVLLAERMVQTKRPVFLSIVCAGAGAAAALLLRSVMINLVVKVFSLEYLKGEAIQRSLTEMLGWMQGAEARAEFMMSLKRMFVLYGAFAYAYYPIFLLVLAGAFLGVYALIRTVKNRDLWILVLTAGCYIVPFFLVLIEGKATLYRSAQFVPLLTASSALMLSMAADTYARRSHRNSFDKLLRRAVNPVVGVLLAVFLINQCIDMNSWFYVDYLKYEDAKNTMNRIDYELEQNFDVSKPVVFTGTYHLPESIVDRAYVDFGSETFFKINRLTGLIDEHLLEKYYREYGVWVAQTPSLSVLDWARYAFDSDEEMVRFFAMHGHSIRPLLDLDRYEEAEKFSLDLPDFPAAGSIVDRGDYLIVHF